MSHNAIARFAEREREDLQWKDSESFWAMRDAAGRDANKDAAERALHGMAANGCLWIPTDADGCEWMPGDADEFQRIPGSLYKFGVQTLDSQRSHKDLWPPGSVVEEEDWNLQTERE